MKKTVTILAILLLAVSCTPKSGVRGEIEKDIKAGLADPASYKFVALDKVRDVTVQNAMASIMTQMYDLYSFDVQLRAEKLTRIDEACQALDHAADSVICSVYRLTYRADIPGKGRAFPMEAFAGFLPDGHYLGLLDDEKDVLATCFWLVPEFVDALE